LGELRFHTEQGCLVIMYIRYVKLYALIINRSKYFVNSKCENRVSMIGSTTQLLWWLMQPPYLKT